MGKTKVFLKSSLLSLLESHRTSSLTHIIIRIQSFLRAHAIRHMYQRMRICWYDVRDHMIITCDDDIIKLKAAIERAREIHVPQHMLQKAVDVMDIYQRQQRAIHALTSVMTSHTSSTLLERADVLYTAQLHAVREGLATTTPIYIQSTSLITTLRTSHPILTSSQPLTDTSLTQLRTTLTSLDEWKLIGIHEMDVARTRISRADTVLDQMTSALSIPQPTSLGGYEQHLTLLCHLYTTAERVPLQHTLCDRITAIILITRAHHLEHHMKQAISRNDSNKLRECIAWMEQEYDDRKQATSTKIYHIHINKQNIRIDVSHIDVMMGMSDMMISLSQAKTTLEQINAVSQLKSNLQQSLHSTDVDVLENAMLQAYTYIHTSSQSQRPSLIQTKSRPGIPPLHHISTPSIIPQHPDTILFGQLVMAWTSCILHTASSSSSLDNMQQALIRIQDRLTSYQSILHTIIYRNHMETPPPLSTSNSVSNSAANSLDVPILSRPTSDSTQSNTRPRPKMVNIRTLNRSIQYESDISISQQHDESDDDTTPHGTLEWKRVGSDLSHVWDHDTSRKNSVIRAARAQQENRTIWQELEEQLTVFRARMEQMETRTRVTTRLHDAITHAQQPSNLHRHTLSFITQSTTSTHDSVLLHHSTLDELRLALAEWRELEHDDVDPMEAEAEKWIRILSDEEAWENEQKHTVIANIKQHIKVAMSDALLIPITTSPRQAQEAIRASRMLPITPTIVNNYLTTAQTLLSHATSLSDPCITLLTTITEHIQSMYTLILAIENHSNVDECITHVRRMMFHGILIDHINWQINAMRWIEAGEEMRSTSPRAKSAMKQHIGNTPRTPAKQVRLAKTIEEEPEQHTPRPTKRQVTFDISAAVAITIPPHPQDEHDMYDELSSRMSTRSVPSRSQWDIEEEMEHVGLKQKILQAMGIKKPMKRRMSVSDSQLSPRMDVLHVHGENESDDMMIQIHFMQGTSSGQGSTQTSPRDGHISPRDKMNASPSPQPTSRSPTHSVAPSPATSVRGTPLPSLSLGQQPMTRRSTNIPTLSMVTSSSGSGSEIPSAMTVASMSISTTSPTVVHTSRVSSSRSPPSDRSTSSTITSPQRLSSGSHKRVPPLRLDSVATSMVIEENVNEEIGVTYGGAFAALSMSPHDIPPDQVAEERYLKTKDPTICPRPPYSALNPIRGTVMYKRSANKSWFSRYEWKPYLFILDGTWLYYYKTHRDSKPRGVLSIRCCAAQEEPDVTRQLRTRRKPKFAFSCYIQKGWSIHRNLRKPTSYIHRKYFFYVDTFQSMNDWISILNQAGSW